VSFFARNRQRYIDRGVDAARIPPGQYVTERWPVLHEGPVPAVDLDTWTFTVDGLVAGGPSTWSWEEFRELPPSQVVADIHCVTKWSRLDTEWGGIAVTTLWELIDPDPSTTHVIVHAVGGYTANLPIEDFVREANLFANTHAGEPLDEEHGGPLRLVVPHLYFWKSVKWVTGFTVLGDEEPGYWEQRGYHIRGDPFREQRFG